MFCFIFVKIHRHRWRWWWSSSSSFESWNMLSYWPGLLSKTQSFYVIRCSPYATVGIILFLGWASLSFSCFVCPSQGLLPLNSHHQSMFRDIFTLGSAPHALLALGTQTGQHSACQRQWENLSALQALKNDSHYLMSRTEALEMGFQ